MDIPHEVIHKYARKARTVLGIAEPDDWEDPMYADDPYEWYSTKEERRQQKLQRSQKWWTNYNNLYLELEALLDDKTEYYTLICECIQYHMVTIPDAPTIHQILGVYANPNMDIDEWDDEIERYYVKKRRHFSENYITKKAIFALKKRDELINEVHEMKRRIIQCWNLIEKDLNIKEDLILAIDDFVQTSAVDTRITDSFKLISGNHKTSSYQSATASGNNDAHASTTINPTNVKPTPIVAIEPARFSKLSTLKVHNRQDTNNDSVMVITLEIHIKFIIVKLRLIFKYGIIYYRVYHCGLVFDRGKNIGTRCNNWGRSYMDLSMRVKLQMPLRICYTKTMYRCSIEYGNLQKLNPLHRIRNIAGFQHFVHHLSLGSLVMNYQQIVVVFYINYGALIHEMTTLLLYKMNA